MLFFARTGFLMRLADIGGLNEFLGKVHSLRERRGFTLCELQLKGYNPDMNAVNTTLSWRSETFSDSPLNLLM